MKIKPYVKEYYPVVLSFLVMAAWALVGDTSHSPQIGQLGETQRQVVRSNACLANELERLSPSCESGREFVSANFGSIK